MTMKVGVVVLSRYSSSRLPGKALIEINRKPILMYIIERLREVFESSQLIIATSTDDSDNPIAGFANAHGIDCYRGSLENVSERFLEAAIKKSFDYVIRINGDNIFLDIPTLREMLDLLNDKPVDFLSNVKDRTFPKGMSIEIVNVNFYKEKLSDIENNSEYREHVTLYFYENPDQGDYYFHYNLKYPQLAGIQLALDTKDDLIRTESIIKHFDKPHWKYNMEEIGNILNEL